MLVATVVLIMSAVPASAQQKLFTATEKSKATTEKVSNVKTAEAAVCNRQACPEQQTCDTGQQTCAQSTECNACNVPNCTAANCKECAGCADTPECTANNCAECPNTNNCCKTSEANAADCNRQTHCCNNGNGPMKFTPKNRKAIGSSVNAKTAEKAEKKNQLGPKEVKTAQAVKKAEKK